MSEPEGWWWPSNAKKAHYMVGFRSLCKKWMTLATSPAYEQGNNDSLDNCAECKKRFVKRQSPKK